MPYVLVAIAVIIVVAGITKLNKLGQPRQGPTPWLSLLVWAVLFVGGLTMWLASGGCIR